MLTSYDLNAELLLELKEGHTTRMGFFFVSTVIPRASINAQMTVFMSMANIQNVKSITIRKRASSEILV